MRPPYRLHHWDACLMWGSWGGLGVGLAGHSAHLQTASIFSNIPQVMVTMRTLHYHTRKVQICRERHPHEAILYKSLTARQQRL